MIRRWKEICKMVTCCIKEYVARLDFEFSFFLCFNILHLKSRIISFILMFYIQKVHIDENNEFNSLSLY